IAISVPVQTACARGELLSARKPCSIAPSSAPSPAAANNAAKERPSKVRQRHSSQTAKPPHSSARPKSVRLASGSRSVIAAPDGRQNGWVRYRECPDARRGHRRWHVRTHLAREPGGLTSDQAMCRLGPYREGEEP